MPRRTAEQAEKSRREILSRAVDLASVEGLEGLTIGRLADLLTMSKSGIFSYFGSKEELQLAVVEAAAEVFEREVLSGDGRGLRRLQELAGAWLRYLESGLFRGGCFFASASMEFDDRPGRVRDRIAELTRVWVGSLQRAAAEACNDGDLEVEPAQVAFEIHAFVQEANWAFQLHGDGAAFARAASAIERTLHEAATPAGRETLADRRAR